MHLNIYLTSRKCLPILEKFINTKYFNRKEFTDHGDDDNISKMVQIISHCLDKNYGED